MSKLRPATGKILCHSEGLGAPDPDVVRRRAEELAVINGHASYTEQDWKQAKFELHGSHDGADSLSDEMGPGTISSESDMQAIDFGHQAPKMGMDDDGNVNEELW